ncbi:MAG: hypothetical protein ACE5HZ_07845 [Fidelibacterota bacterium]
MKFFSTEKYTDVPDRSVLTRVAEKIVDHGMSVPAVFYLEMVKPLSFIGSQALVFFGPIITSFVQSEGYYQVVELLEDRNNVEFLIQEIERLEEKQGEESEKEAS